MYDLFSVTNSARRAYMLTAPNKEDAYEVALKLGVAKKRANIKTVVKITNTNIDEPGGESLKEILGQEVCGVVCKVIPAVNGMDFLKSAAKGKDPFEGREDEIRWQLARTVKI